MQISPARRAAFEVLRRVEAESAYSSALLAKTDDDLNARDRALCHELVLGVLRRQLWLDLTIENFAARPIDSLDPGVVIALRLGLYQLRFLSRIPPSAAINESVNLVKAARLKSAATFANAVLRRATREPDYDPAAGVTDEFEKLAIETSHPRWLVERWIRQFGPEEAAAIARANNEPAVVAFRFTAGALRDGDDSTAGIINQLRAAGAVLVDSKIAPGAWRLVREPDGVSTTAGPGQAGMTLLLRKLTAAGLIYFQDEASQMIAQLLDAAAGEMVLDLCAAPGSKSTLMAALSPETRIVAGDLYEHRVRTMKGLATQQQARNIQIVVHDASRDLPFPPRLFDRVLVDAPCSGTGTLRHNPEIRWRLTIADIIELRDKQIRILDHVSVVVRPGGLLLYSTCSLERDENEAVVADFLKDHTDFEIAPAKLRPDLLTETGAVRTWPHREGVDGFFATGFKRKTQA
jgi:16S rRNA (cytosine967-C5)-methyltransferase